MPEKLELISGGLVNIILGALILWVGQTTFQHAGVLASCDEKLAAIEQQFLDVEKRHEGLRKWLENVVTDIKDNNRSQFTAKDGDKVVNQVRNVEQFALELERRFTSRVGALEVKLAALETSSHSAAELATLRTEVAQLRWALAKPIASPAVQYQATPYQSADNVAQGTPVYLPPVGTLR